MTEQIHKNWTDLIEPKQLTYAPGLNAEREGTVIMKPLEKGYALTLGNALRRVLLSSLRGSAVTGIRIQGIIHEFSSIPGIKEDLVHIILNLKGLEIKLHSEEKIILPLKVKGPKKVTASDFSLPASVEILNPDHYLMELDNNTSIEAEIFVSKGKGYVPASQNKSEEDTFDTIPVDAIFTPVKKVSYEVESVREGDILDYDKLSLYVKTNGTISPEDAIALGARILKHQLDFFINFEEPEVEQEPEEIPEHDIRQKQALLTKIEELELSVRSANCLKNDNVLYVADLVQRTEQDMLKTPNFGLKSLSEIKSILERMKLRLGMVLEEDWDTEKELRKLQNITRRRGTDL